MKSLHWPCRMRKCKFPMIMIRVASPHFLSAPSTRRTPLLWIFARWRKLSWKPPGRSRTTICPIRISTNSSLSIQSSKNAVFSRLFAYLMFKPYVFSLVFALMSQNKGNFFILHRLLYPSALRNYASLPL
jgi:hypothetical protein